MCCTTLLESQVGYIFTVRNLKSNDTPMALFSGNINLYYGILAVAVLQVLFTYAPGFQYVFKTEAQDGIAWAKCVLFGVVTFLLVEFEKYLGSLKRKYCRRSVAEEDEEED